jgi:multiple sugar transport system substrate-binding protein
MKRRTVLAAGAAAATMVGRAAHAADFTVWGLQAFNQAADAHIGEMVRAFGRERGVAAEYVVVPANALNDRLAAAFQGGAPPDCFMQVGGRAQFYIANNLVIPLDEIVETMRQVPGGIFERHLIVGRSPHGIQAVPLEVDVSPLFVRTDLLRQVGREVPRTWEDLRESARLIQARNPTIAGFGMTVSTANDAEGQMRNLIWSFGGQVMAEDGRTIVFNSAETRAAYQFAADMFLNDRTIPRAALTWDDAGNNAAYQTGRAAMVINPPSIWYWMDANDRTLMGNSAMVSIPRGPGPNGRIGNAMSSWVWQVSRASRRQDVAKDWLRYFFQPARYREVIEKVGGRWAPIFPQMLTELPLFASNPAFADFRTLAAEGFADGHAGPPNALSGRVYDANVITRALQRVLVDRASVADAVTWAQQQIEALARG